jgi:hypothetical protein
MKKLLLLAAAAFSPSVFANQLISIQPGSTITLSPSILTTVTCSGSPNGGTFNQYRCICDESSSHPPRFGIIQFDAQTGAQIQRLTDYNQYGQRSQCITALTSEFRELCN